MSDKLVNYIIAVEKLMRYLKKFRGSFGALHDNHSNFSEDSRPIFDTTVHAKYAEDITEEELKALTDKNYFTIDEYHDNMSCLLLKCYKAGAEKLYE